MGRGRAPPGLSARAPELSGASEIPGPVGATDREEVLRGRDARALSPWPGIQIPSTGGVTPARLQLALDSSHRVGPRRTGAGISLQTPGLAGRHRLREGCVRRTDTDNTAGAPPPPALKGAAPSPGGAEPTRGSELEKGGGGQGGLSCTRRGFRDENRRSL